MPEELTADALTTFLRMGLMEMGPKRPPPFSVHRIVISGAWWDEDQDQPDYDFELVHPDECLYEECSVWFDLHEGGYLHEVLCGYAYPRDQQTYPWVTTYFVRTWVQNHDVPGMPIEYDQGLYVGFKEEDV